MSYQVQIITGGDTYVESEHQSLEAAIETMDNFVEDKINSGPTFIKIATAEAEFPFYLNKELVLEIGIEETPDET